MFFFQAEDGIRDLVRSRGLGDVYKRQVEYSHLFYLSSGNKRTCCKQFVSAVGFDYGGAASEALEGRGTKGDAQSQIQLFANDEYIFII